MATPKTTATKRKSISKKTRFEVFKRDSFKCQYCGKCAPDIILHVDHIHPVSKGGESEILNYITACVDCNSGKSDRLLSDDSAIVKQRAQLDELNIRREQLEQMLVWRESMRDFDETLLDVAKNTWEGHAPEWCLNEVGEKDLKNLISKYGLQIVLNAIDICSKYLKIEDGKATQESVSLAFTKIGGICRLSQQPDWRRELYYIRGIARNRFTYINPTECLQLLEEAYATGIDIDDLRNITLFAKNWSIWQQEIRELIGCLHG